MLEELLVLDDMHAVVERFRERFPARSESSVRGKYYAMKHRARAEAARREKASQPSERTDSWREPGGKRAWDVTRAMCELLETLSTRDEQRRALTAAATLMGVYEEDVSMVG